MRGSHDWQLALPPLRAALIAEVNVLVGGLQRLAFEYDEPIPPEVGTTFGRVWVTVRAGLQLSWRQPDLLEVGHRPIARVGASPVAWLTELPVVAAGRLVQAWCILADRLFKAAQAYVAPYAAEFAGAVAELVAVAPAAPVLRTCDAVLARFSEAAPGATGDLLRATVNAVARLLEAELRSHPDVVAEFFKFLAHVRAHADSIDLFFYWCVRGANAAEAPGLPAGGAE